MRLFVALSPPAAALEHLAASLARPVDPRWHVTLVFLGEVDDPAVLAEGLARAAASSPLLELSLRGSGRFGRTTWAGVAGDLPGLSRLQAAVAAACRQAGVELEERRYHPHLTVGRLPLRPDPGYAGPTWTADRFALVRSVLGARAVHTVLAEHPLTGG